MHMRRRNCEHTRIKRNNRKFKTAETFCSIFGNYFKVLVIWAIFIMLDYFIDFRFEFLLSCWVFIRTVSDSFRYEGLAFAFFFSLIAVTSDLFCYFLVPTTLLYLLGSSIIWIQLVWQAGGAGALTTVGDRGVYGSMAVLCFLFVYVEIAVRLRDPKSLPLGIDLCRPFAAHCIGYPVVTLGFNLKSMIAHQFRVRRQRTVGAQNMTYFALLDEARVLKDCKDYDASVALDGSVKSKRPSSADGCQAPSLPYPRGNTGNHTNHISALSAGRERYRKSNTVQHQQQQCHGSKVDPSLTGTYNCTQQQIAKVEGGFCEEQFPSAALDGFSTDCVPHCSESLRNPTVCNLQLHAIARTHGGDSHASGEPGSPSTSNNNNGPAGDFFCSCLPLTTANNAFPTTAFVPPSTVPTSTANDGADSCRPSQAATPVSSAVSVVAGCPVDCKPKSTAGKSGASTPANSILPGSKSTSSSAGGKNANKDEYTLKLEAEVRNLKSDLQSLRALEMDLRDQVQQLTLAERAYRSEISQARQESESLQAKLGQLSDRFQADKANTQAAEKRLAEEQKQRSTLEQQLLQLQQQKQTSSSRNKRSTAVISNHDEAASQRQVCPGRVSRGTLTNISGVGDLLTVGTGDHWSSESSSNNNSSSNHIPWTSTTCGDASCASRIKQLQSELDFCVANEGGGSGDGHVIAAKKPHTKDSTSSRTNSGAPIPLTNGISNAAKHSLFSECGYSRKEFIIEQQTQFSTTADKVNSELSSRLVCLKEENQRLTDTLKDEDQMKQKLMTAYHSSLKEITELNATLTKKEYQIVELNMRLDELTPRLWECVNRMNAPTYPTPSTSCSFSTPSPSILSSSNATFCLPPPINSGISDLVDSLFFPPHHPSIAQQSSTSNGTPVSSEAMFADSLLHHQQIVSSPPCDAKAEAKLSLALRGEPSGICLPGDNLTDCTMHSILASGPVTTNTTSMNNSFDAMSQPMSYFGGRPYKVEHPGNGFRITATPSCVLNSTSPHGSSSAVSGTTTVGGCGGSLDYYPYRLINGGDCGHSPFPLTDTLSPGQPAHHSQQQHRSHTTQGSLFSGTSTNSIPTNNNRVTHHHSSQAFSSSSMSPTSLSDNFAAAGRPSMIFHSVGLSPPSVQPSLSSHDPHITSNRFGGEDHPRHQPTVGSSMSRFKGVTNQRHQLPTSYSSEVAASLGYGASASAASRVLKGKMRQLPIGHSVPVSSPPSSVPPPGLATSTAVTATANHPFAIGNSLVGCLFSSLHATQCCEPSPSSETLPLVLSNSVSGIGEPTVQSPLPSLMAMGKSSDKRGVMNPNVDTGDGKVDLPRGGYILDEEYDGLNSSRANANYYATQVNNDLPDSTVDVVGTNKDPVVLPRCQIGSCQPVTEAGE